MSKFHKLCAHLIYDDKTSKDLKLEVLKRTARHKFLIRVSVKANTLNKNIIICKNGKVALDIEAPKKCPSGCDCDSFSMSAVI